MTPELCRLDKSPGDGVGFVMIVAIVVALMMFLFTGKERATESEVMHRVQETVEVVKDKCEESQDE